jgi:alginate O-acetyltransferase complex protein AlgI
MLFNSLVFIVFAAVFFTLWPMFRKYRSPRYLLLVVSSFVFYGWWDWRFLFLIIASGLLDFVSGLGMEAWPRFRKFFLGLSVFGNVGSLMAFKYSGFFADNISALLGLFGLDVQLRTGLPPFVLILPVGISFYTFQSMSYTIDIYKGQLKPTRNVLHFFSYLSMFPQLVAGPIIRAADLLPQLKEYRNTTEAERWEGMRLVVHGYVKKVFIADNLAYFVTEAFNNPVPLDGSLYWWVVMTAFAFQIYCDFSGYSDIARGLAKWMGYDFMVNFNHPYVSTSLREFWSRWHISLSTWFRDYVYIPLGGSKNGRLSSEGNMWITMLVSGFWHGAAWNFIIWGGLHAFGTSFERITGWPKKLAAKPGGRLLSSLIVLTGVWVTWVFFRAQTMDQAFFVLSRMFSFQGGAQDLMKSLGGVKLINLSIIIGIAALREAWFFYGFDQKSYVPDRYRIHFETVVMAVLIVVCVFFRGAGSQFIYFQF